MIISIILGGLVILLLLGYCIYKSRKKAAEKDQGTTEVEFSDPAQIKQMMAMQGAQGGPGIG